MTDLMSHRVSDLHGEFRALETDLRKAVGFAWAVWDQASGTYLFRSTPASDPPSGIEAFTEPGWVVHLWQRTPRLSNLTAVPLDTVASMLSVAAQILQDAAMDQLGHGWPELYEGDAFAGLLTPQADAAGQLWWSVKGHHACRAGSLDALNVR